MAAPANRATPYLISIVGVLTGMLGHDGFVAAQEAFAGSAFNCPAAGVFADGQAVLLVVDDVSLALKRNLGCFKPWSGSLF